VNLEVLRQEIEADEGCKYETYYCSEGHLTGGIGHLITDWDEEIYSGPIGTPIPEEQVKNWFDRDVQQSINDCISLFDNFDKLPEDIQHVLTNMSFQLGRPRLSKFKKMIAAVHNEDYREMAAQMEDSRWHKQTTNRANRLIERVLQQSIPA
jgi:lysozyme